MLGEQIEDGLRLDEVDDIVFPMTNEFVEMLKQLATDSTVKGNFRADIELRSTLQRFNDSSFVQIPNFTGLASAEAIKYIDAYTPKLAGITDEGTKEAIKGVLLKATQEGWTNQQIVDRLGTIAALSPSRLENIARTESIKFYNAGKVERYTDPTLGDFVRGMVYDSILDSRTTDVCRKLDGYVVDINDEANIAKFTPPNHFRCRAVWTVVTKFDNHKISKAPPGEPAPGFQTSVNLRNLRALERALPTPLTGMSVAQIHALTPEQFKSEIRRLKDPAERLKYVREYAAGRMEQESVFKVATEVPFKVVKQTAESFTYSIDGIEYTVTGPPEQLARFAKAFKERRLVNMPMLTGSDVASRVNWFNQSDTIAKYNQMITQKTTRSLNPKAFAQPRGENMTLTKFFKVEEVNSFNILGNYPHGLPSELRPVMKKEARDAVNWLNKHFDRNLLHTVGSKDNILYLDFTNTRAYASGNSIVMGPSNKSRTYVHEIGHLLHNGSPEVQRLTRAFFEDRTVGEDLASINWANEMGKKDGFRDGYVGRVYPFEDVPGGLEVVSMGLEYMYADPVNFYKEDKDHFTFIYALMKGYY